MIQSRQFALQGELALILCAGLEAGVDPQTGLGEILVMIVTAQRAPDEIQVRRIVTARSTRRDAKRFLLRRKGVIRLHDTALRHELEHEVAPRARAFSMP